MLPVDMLADWLVTVHGFMLYTRCLGRIAQCLRSRVRDEMKEPMYENVRSAHRNTQIIYDAVIVRCAHAHGQQRTHRYDVDTLAVVPCAEPVEKDDDVDAVELV